MNSQISNSLYLALESQYQAQIRNARATLLVYFNNPVGIGEHPQHLEEMDKLVASMVDGHDKLTLLRSEFKKLFDPDTSRVCSP